MSIQRYQRPYLFYGLSTLIPWTLWFAAAYMSHLPTDWSLAVSALGVAGLFVPTIIAFRMIWPDPLLRADIKGRLYSLNGVTPSFLLLAVFLMPASILLAQGVSLLFGYSADQFQLAGTASFSAGVLPGWFLLLLAPLVEELAWHTYGTDCLRVRMNLFRGSLLFAVFWAFWHMPLSLIKDYYHSNVAETGLLYSLNFAFSLIPFVILMNWLYYKTGRNVLVVIVFHILAGCSNEAFATHPDSKLIQTVVLSLIAAYLLYRDREFFFQRSYQEARVRP
jgi:membrane protease YdiL (CAAX protease family)